MGNSIFGYGTINQDSIESGAFHSKYTSLPTKEEALTPEINKIENRDSNEVVDIVITSPLKEITKGFTQEYHIIWFDSNVSSHEKKEYIKNIEDYHSLEKYSDWGELAQFITKNTIKTFIILCGIVHENQIQEVNELAHVQSIYIFDRDIQYYPISTNNYTKIALVTHDFPAMLQALNEQIMTWQRNNSIWRIQLPAFIPIFSYSDISYFNLLYNTIKRLPCIENRSQAMKDFLQLSKEFMHEKHSISQFENIYTKYDMETILKWYTKQTFLYKIINNALRIATYDSLSYCRLILNDLQQAIKEQYQQQSKNFDGIVYKGTYVSYNELLDLYNSIDKDIQIHGFLSTIKNRDKAVEYAKNALLTIIIPKAIDKLENQGFAELGKDQEFENEEEVLFNIMSTFRVLSITHEKKENGSQYSNIVLLYEAHELKKHLYENNKLITIELSHLNNAICSKCQRKYERKDEDYPWFVNLKDQTKSLCQNCLEDKNLVDEDVMLKIPSPGFFDTTKKIKGFFMKSLMHKYYQEANLKCTKCTINYINLGLNFECMTCKTNNFMLCSQCSIKCSISSHIIIIHLGRLNIWFEDMSHSEYVHSEMLNSTIEEQSYLNKELAFLNQRNCNTMIKHYEKYLTQTSNRELMAACYNNIGLAYNYKEIYNQAIEYLTKAIKIRLEAKEEACLDLAECFNNISLVYNNKGDYEETITYSTMARKIYQKLLGIEHPLVALCYNNIGLAYDNNRLYDHAIECFEKSLKIRKEAYGETHPSVIESYKNIGNSYLCQAEYDKADEFLNKSLILKQ